MRDRLVELINQRIDNKTWTIAELADYLLAKGVMVVDSEVVTNLKPLQTMCGMPLDEVAELITAKEEGRLIVPPCKVGDTVYKVVRDKRVKKPYECEVVGFWYSKDENCNNAHLVRYVNGVFDSSFSVPLMEFGKTVFLTREEAEAKLKGEQ